MWRVANEAYAYLAGHPFLTDTVLHNRKIDNVRQIINKQHAAAEINRLTNQHKSYSSSLAEDGVITSTILNTVLQYQLQYLIKQLAIIFESKYILSLLLNFNNFNLH